MVMDASRDCFRMPFLRDLGIGSELWSVSRGLARNVSDYKRLLSQADQPRRGDLDGRGDLTQAGLTEFTAFFLSCCLDQVTFMEELLKPEELLNRIEIWCNEEVQMQRLPKGSWPLLREAVLSGEFFAFANSGANRIPRTSGKDGAVRSAKLRCPDIGQREGKDPSRLSC